MLQRTSPEDQHNRLLFALDEEHGLLNDIDESSSRQSSRPASPAHQNHHSPRLWIRQLGRWVNIVTYALVLFFSIRVVKDYEQPGDVRFRGPIEYAVAHPKPSGYAKQEKIFIAAMFSNNHEVLPYWSDTLIKTIHYLGTNNVFVSVVESHSDDNSPDLLRALDRKLAHIGVARRILTEDESINKPEDMGGNNRIDFLAAIRNRALEPLMENGGYDKVIFSNDIFIEPETIVELLETAEGEYDMACGLDFAHFGAYDAWVLRDRQGKLASSVWPYFFDEADYQAMHTESPVPVFTCWNGIIVVRADPLLPIALRSNGTLSTDPLSTPLPTTHPAAHIPPTSPALTPPLRFRASAPGECFSSESFLLPYDLRRQFNMQRIYVNPRVITAYQWRFYLYFKWFMRHPVLKWWIEKMYDGAWMQRAVMVVGDASHIFWWDGGDCHPWW
ncbi:glycosyltransferase family 69 protein [Hygrophoropsis aurantiaca]|uniref:Glycosyltransferase family 69 protein n=1 Tax=Hygrophoropsis aurantiaca TaxID=72124 RepID=A0ACB7ZYZ8_9AGAM|nr:glycosyltransferase family 69 protein [Hygrophoropsis aurantiaca]